LEAKKYIYKVLSEIRIKINICLNEIKLPNENEKNNIIFENHSTTIGGHKGITKTFNRIRQNYSWPYMKRDVEKFVNNCRECQTKKLVRIKPKMPMILTDTPDASFDKVSMDVMGPLPVSPIDNSYILTIQDLLTKYLIIIPMKNALAVCIAQAFTEEFIYIRIT
jgi:hypothetical protein